MSLYSIQDTSLTDIADAIRSKTGKTASMTPAGMVDEIESIGGGSATLIAKTITENGTYSAEDDDADGYSSVTVNVPSSGTSSWTKVAETSYQVSTTSTSATSVGTITCNQSIWTRDKLVYVKVRDTAGPRVGYFYGSDTFIINESGNKQQASFSNASRWIWKYANSSTGYSLKQANGTTVYGIAQSNAIRSASPYDIQISVCYNKTYSGTIDGIYKVEVYLLDPPTGAPIFE